MSDIHSDSNTDITNTYPVLWSVNDIPESNPDKIHIIFNNDDRCDDMDEQPLDWINWLSLSIDEKDNSIHLNISTEDCRGSQLGIHLTKNTNKKSLIYNEAKPVILDINEVKYCSHVGLCRINMDSLSITSDEIKTVDELKNELEQKNKYIEELEARLMNR
jgi:hypothetical protein